MRETGGGKTAPRSAAVSHRMSTAGMAPLLLLWTFLWKAGQHASIGPTTSVNTGNQEGSQAPRGGCVCCGATCMWTCVHTYTHTVCTCPYKLHTNTHSHLDTDTHTCAVHYTHIIYMHVHKYTTCVSLCAHVHISSHVCTQIHTCLCMPVCVHMPSCVCTATPMPMYVCAC